MHGTSWVFTDGHDTVIKRNGYGIAHLVMAQSLKYMNTWSYKLVTVQFLGNRVTPFGIRYVLHAPSGRSYDYLKQGSTCLCPACTVETINDDAVL